MLVLALYDIVYILMSVIIFGIPNIFKRKVGVEGGLGQSFSCLFQPGVLRSVQAVCSSPAAPRSDWNDGYLES